MALALSSSGALQLRRAQRCGAQAQPRRLQRCRAQAEPALSVPAQAALSPDSRARPSKLLTWLEVRHAEVAV